MPDETPDTPDDVEIIDNGEDLIKQDPLIGLFGDTPRIRFFRVLLDAHNPINPSEIVRRANVGKTTWYNHEDALLATGLIEQTGNAGNSPLYAVVNADDDPRVEWLEKLRAWTRDYQRDWGNANE